MFVCANPHCSHEFNNLRCTSEGSHTPSRHDLLLCPDCGHLNILDFVSLGDRSLSIRLLTQDEYLALSEEEKTDLRFAIKVIQAKFKKKTQRQLIVPPWYQG